MRLEACPNCRNSDLQSAEHTQTFRFGDSVITVKTPAMACSSCGERLIVAADVRRAEHAAARKLTEMGIQGGAVFRFLRKTAGLTGLQLADLLGVAKDTISRWENDTRPIPRAAMAVVGMLALDKINGVEDAHERLQALSREEPQEILIEVTNEDDGTNDNPELLDELLVLLLEQSMKQSELLQKMQAGGYDLQHLLAKLRQISQKSRTKTPSVVKP